VPCSCQIVFNFSFFLADFSSWAVFFFSVTLPQVPQKIECKRCGETRQEINFSFHSLNARTAHTALVICREENCDQMTFPCMRSQLNDDINLFFSFLHSEKEKVIFAFLTLRDFISASLSPLPSGADVQHISSNICCIRCSF
jgi:hypothetical protein